MAFFEHGRAAYRMLRQDVYREVRAAYRKEWATYYRIMKHGASKERLTVMRTGLLARQSATLQERSREAVLKLRADGDAYYKDVLTRQKHLRAELAERQSAGMTSPGLLLGQEHRSPPSYAPPSRTREAAFGPRWTQRAGPALQQQSARRRLDFARDRITRTHKKEHSTNILERERPRTRRSESGKRSERGFEATGGGPES